MIYNQDKLGAHVLQTHDITVLSAWDDNMNDLAAVVLPNREAYCLRHGYKHVTGRQYDRPGMWWKIPMLQQSTSLWSVWMDLDILITNPAIRLESFLDTDADLIVSWDINGLNAGVVFCRKSDWSTAFLKKWWEDGWRYKDYASPEQSSLAYLLYREPKDRWECRPQRDFNSFDYAHYGYGPWPEGQHQPGDFVLHLPALPNHVRIQRFKDLMR